MNLTLKPFKPNKVKCIYSDLHSLGKLTSTSEALEQFNKISAIHLKQIREDYIRHKETIKQICTNFKSIQASLKYGCE